MDPNIPQGSIYDSPQLQSARGAYEGASRAATTAESEGISLPDRLRETLTKKFSTDNPLIAGRESALKNYLTVGASAPLDYTHTSAGGKSDVIYNPLQQAALIQGRRAGATAPLATSNYLLGVAQGGIGEVTDATSRANQAMTTQLMGEANLKRQSYTDILTELSQRAEEARYQAQLQAEQERFQAEQQFQREQLQAESERSDRVFDLGKFTDERDFNEKVRQFNVSEANNLKKSAAGVGSTAEIEALKAIFGLDKPPTPVQNKTSKTGAVNYSANSPQMSSPKGTIVGNWISEGNFWTPIIN